MRKWLIVFLVLGITLAGAFIVYDRQNQAIPKEQELSSQGELQDEALGKGDQAPVVGIRTGNLAPDFTLENLDQEKVSLSDFKGKQVLLNFWSTECIVCREEMPELNEFYLKMKDENLVVLGVSLGESRDKVKTFMEEGGYQFPILLDSDLEITFQYSILYMPTTFFINEAGIIEGMKIGALTLDELNQIYDLQ